MSVSTIVGNIVPLAMVLADGNELQYPQANVYPEGASTPSATLNLVHKDLGRYEATYIPTIAGIESVVYVTYSDAGHTVESAEYDRAVEQLVIAASGLDQISEMVTRILGLVHENVFIDNTVHDAMSNLVSARIRVFDSKINVEAATDGGGEIAGLVAAYDVETVYEADCKMGSYRVKKT